MLVTDVGDQMCWWQVWDVCDRFRMLVTDLIHQHNEKSRQHNDSATVLPTTVLPTSHHPKITNITMSPTSLTPRNCWHRDLATIVTNIGKFATDSSFLSIFDVMENFGATLCVSISQSGGFNRYRLKRIFNQARWKMSFKLWRTPLVSTA